MRSRREVLSFIGAGLAMGAASKAAAMPALAKTAARGSANAGNEFWVFLHGLMVVRMRMDGITLQIPYIRQNAGMPGSIDHVYKFGMAAKPFRQGDLADLAPGTDLTSAWQLSGSQVLPVLRHDELTVLPEMGLEIVKSPASGAFFEVPLPLPLDVVPVSSYRLPAGQSFYAGQMAQDFNLHPSQLPQVVALRYVTGSTAPEKTIGHIFAQPQSISSASSRVHGHHAWMMLEEIYAYNGKPLDLQPQPIPVNSMTPATEVIAYEPFQSFQLWQLQPVTPSKIVSLPDCGTIITCPCGG